MRKLKRCCTDPDQRLKVTGLLLAGIHSVLYFPVAIEGGNNIFVLFHSERDASGDPATFDMSIAAAVINALLVYDTLMALSLKIHTRASGFFSVLAPLAASALFSAGMNGAKLLKWNSMSAWGASIFLFLCRTLHYIDAAIKFPERWYRMRCDWRDAATHRQYGGMARLMVTGTTSVGYAVCATDAMNNTIKTILMKITRASIAHPMSAILSTFGAVGTLPSNLELIYKGVKQLTFGGQEDGENTNPDSTDRYTYLSLLCLLPLILGILGEITASTEETFGQGDDASQALRVLFALLYATFVGTPLMAPVLRGVGQYLQENWSRWQKRNEQRLLDNPVPRHIDSPSVTFDTARPQEDEEEALTYDEHTPWDRHSLVEVDLEEEDENVENQSPNIAEQPQGSGTGYKPA